MTLFAGWDQSINHGALVVLNDAGRLLGWRLLVESSSYARTRDYASAFPPAVTDKKVPAAIREARRLAYLRDWFRQAKTWLAELALESGSDVVLVVEDYALGQARRAHQIGEAGGQLRTVLLAEPWLWPTEGARVRLIGPTTVKKAGSGYGAADKDDMYPAACDWLDTADLNILDEDVCAKDVTRGDIADAVVMAFIGLIEHRLRQGTTTLDKLPQAMRASFLHTTPTQPENILSRPYLSWQDVGACV